MLIIRTFLFFLISLLAACGSELNGETQWEKHSRGIKEPNWTYCQESDNGVTRCFEKVSSRAPQELPESFFYSVDMGTELSWEERSETFSDRLKNLNATGQAKKFRGNVYVTAFYFSHTSSTLTAIRDVCAIEMGLDPFIIETDSEVRIGKGFEDFGFKKEQSCLNRGNERYCLAQYDKPRSAIGIDCYLRVKLLPQRQNK